MTHTLTVADLRARLADYPDDLPVLVEGYESGFDALALPCIETVVRFKKAKEWNGLFDRAAAFKAPQPDAFDAVLLVSTRRKAQPCS